MKDKFEIKQDPRGDSGISVEESLLQCLLYFDEAVSSFCLGVDYLHKKFGDHPGVAWEVKQEFLSGKSLIAWEGIPNSRREAIRKIVMAVEGVPDAGVDGVSDFSHAAWSDVRDAAVEYQAFKDS
ncbi:hypothetical protein [Xanthomonas rydalmerensis]|uniref:Uncharacterized protein n=1 Tax=Xanthomonas rydalmerensis TaxID=3046274 RepID=A0ABZ0JHE3_9XANT|nr:hypothetical protein [Xanthomonas sp. DM-2023]WOS39237.1 hypothetical protein QN243_12370 [Xanthomonas sp. DM-2023]WOS43420.1 hypothetical protein QN242_12370 [Xanthomonas sp. DM-2023]WOS47600.1 hypothetical protein QN240_12370 [Xanthomonas sp. DM-2023]WOS51780.1 hypothetical protein QN244_12370 [Xanthomonas sp. DM-2023]WOS55963.1 hypothetical protein QN245_12370 [Xanthomonas sp. DM-2023]